MRTGLIAAVTRTHAGELRAELPFAGRSVLAWQVALLRDLGAERILCLCETTTGEVLRLQHSVEATGAAFHALKGFGPIPALVRAEDDLVILRDGLLPDPAITRSLLDAGPAPQRMVACLPTDHPLPATNPDDFERIDATRHWAGLLIMRGAPVQQLADFPADADAVSVLLRLALQAGTPCRELAPPSAEAWLLADSARTVAVHEQALIRQSVPMADWRAPLATLASLLVRSLAPRGLGRGALVAAGAALVLLLSGLIAAALGAGAAGLALTAAGAFAARVSSAYTGLATRLRRLSEDVQHGAALTLVVDVIAALTVWFALAPWPDWAPLAVCGPVVIGLARLAERTGGKTLAVLASDRASQLLLLALAAAFGFLPDAVAMLAAALLSALLLRKTPI